MTIDDLFEGGFKEVARKNPGWKVSVSDIVTAVLKRSADKSTLLNELTNIYIPRTKLAWRLLTTAAVLEALSVYYSLTHSGANTSTAVLSTATILTAAAGGHFGGLCSLYRKARDYLLDGRNSQVYKTSLFL